MWKYFKFWDIVTRPEQGKISLDQFILDVLISLLQIQITQPPQSCFSVVIFIMSQINCLIFWNLSYVRKCQADQLKSRSSFIDTKNRHYFVSRLLQSSKKWLKPDLSLEWENIYNNYNLYFSEFTQFLTEREYEAESIQITKKYSMVILYLLQPCQEYLGLQVVSGTSPWRKILNQDQDCLRKVQVWWD